MKLLEYENKEPIAINFIAMGCAMAILDIQYGIDDYVIIKGFTGDLHRYKIHYGTERPYFRYCNGCRYHIDEFLRV